MALADEAITLQVGDLHPDPENPRLRPDQRGQLSDDQLLVFIAETYEPVVIAESIARYGYFGSEPMIVCDENGQWVVLEGNRRLTALAGLARPDLRAQFPNPEVWDKLAECRPINVTMAVPVIVADDRQDADAVIGFRHIAGIIDWKPLQRAQFIAYLVDVREKSFLEVADTVGEEEEVVKMLYRNQGIIGRARELGRDDLANASEERFGTFTAALNRNGIREYIGARTVGAVAERQSQLADDKLVALQNLSGWLYGTRGDDRDGRIWRRHRRPRRRGGRFEAHRPRGLRSHILRRRPRAHASPDP